MKNLKTILKRWKTLANPSKKDFIIEFIFYSIVTILKFIIAIPAALVIVNLKNQNFDATYYYLWLTFSLIIIKQIFWHLEYINNSKYFSRIYKNITKKIYNKILITEDFELKNNSKEKITNILSKDIGIASDLIYKIDSSIIKFILTIATTIWIFTVDIYVGFVFILIIIINFKALSFISTNLTKSELKEKEIKQDVYETIFDFIKNKDLIYRTNSKQKTNEMINMKSSLYIDNIRKKRLHWLNIKNNVYIGVYEFIIAIITIILIYFISINRIDFGLYLILIAYIKQIATDSYNALGIIYEIKKVDVSVLRINSILNFSEVELIQYGNNYNDNINASLEFINVDYKSKNKENKTLNKINFSLEKNKITLIKGSDQSGREEILSLLNRNIKPLKGVILIDNINIYEFDNSVYKSNFNSASSNPIFLKGSILYNFKMINKDKEEIIKICKKLNIHNYINSLSKKYNTDINNNIDIISKEKLFLLDIARAILTESEIIAIDEIPNTMKKNSILNLKEILKTKFPDKLFIFFTKSENKDYIGDKIIEINRGKIIIDKKELLNIKGDIS